MLDVSDEAASVMTGSFVLYARVASWRGSQLLDDDVPISAGNVSIDVTLAVPESLTISVPREFDGVSYVPNDNQNHPLAPWGQRLHVTVGCGSGTTGGVEWFNLGWFYITDSVLVNDVITVTASGLLGLVQEANFISPFTPSGNFSAVTRQLVQPALSVDFTNAPADRTVPASAVNWDQGRLDALTELMNAWPATFYVNENGILVVQAVGDTSTSSLDLSDDDGGTTMQWGADMKRDGAANAVVARDDATGLDVQAVVYDTSATSPTVYGGSFNQLPVPFVYYSPLLTTIPQCAAAATTILAKRKRQASRTITTTAVPYLALEARDGVTVTSTALGIDSAFGIVDGLTIPLVATNNAGLMTLSVRLPS